jgi:hypothetical protein
VTAVVAQGGLGSLRAVGAGKTAGDEREDEQWAEHSHGRQRAVHRACTSPAALRGRDTTKHVIAN